MTMKIFDYGTAKMFEIFGSKKLGVPLGEVKLTSKSSMV